MKLGLKTLNLEYEGGTLYLNETPRKPDVRTIRQMSKVLFDPDARKQDPEMPIYYMYRDLAPELKQAGVRLDVTILPPIMLGHEFNKTLGHYHPPAVPGWSYSELYNVLEGEAHYLLQKPSPTGSIEDVILVTAKKGDCIPMPPNYGHITINPGKGPLIMANLVYPGFESEYFEYEQKRGGAYYELTGGKFIQNPTYGLLPQLKIRKGGCKREFKPDILAAYQKDPKPFEFLKDPTLFKE